MTEMTRDEMLKLLADQKALIEKQAQALSTKRDASMTLKVGKSGTLCLYHGARYPIALYREQWERLLPFMKSGKIEEFISANSALLATKD